MNPTDPTRIEKRLDRLFHRLPADLDLRDEVQLDSVLALADELLSRVDGANDLDALESLIESAPERWPMAVRVVVKLARSKQVLGERPGPLHLSVVVPLYAEHERILRPHESSVGEGFLDRKIRQLDWLCGRGAERSWDLLLVDDGCPFGSGRIAEGILTERHPGAPVKVLYVEEAIERGHVVLQGLGSSRDSQKGGAVHLGLWEAAHGVGAKQAGQIVAFTDADLSTHLGQLGLLVDALDEPGVRLATGTRRAPTSAVVKNAGRSARGRLFIYLWKKMLPELAYLDDTQCGFKAIRAEHVGPIVASATERGFAFDLELLMRSELLVRRSVAAVPIAWIDSEASSNTASTSVHLEMLRRVVALSRSIEGRRRAGEDFAKVVDSLCEARWQSAIEQFGSRLEACDPRLDAGESPILAAELLELDPDRLTALV